jgi:RNA polymerase sigma-70 factor (ECF subfamily)
MYVKSIEIAEELTSDVFFAVWENRKKLPEIIDFKAYIYKLAQYKAMNYLRDQRISYIDLDDVPIDLFASTETTPEDDLISKETISAINEAIEQLPSKCKLAFKLVKEDRMKYKDAAELLNISVKTLEAHLATALKKIKEKLSAD